MDLYYLLLRAADSSFQHHLKEASSLLFGALPGAGNLWAARDFSLLELPTLCFLKVARPFLLNDNTSKTGSCVCSERL